jgi:hypothetical protein
MHRLLMSVLLAMPLNVGAGPLLVEYEGKIDWLEDDPLAPIGYKVGDSVRGFLKIDLASAPSDSGPRPLQGYGSLYGVDDVSGFADERTVNFVTGYNPTQDRQSGDGVAVTDSPYADSYSIWDAVGVQGSPPWRALHLVAYDRTGTLLSSTSIDQSFVVEGPEHVSGTFYVGRLLGDVFHWSAAYFNDGRIAVCKK